MRTILVASALAALPAGAASADPVIIDFESTAGVAPADDLAINGQYNTADFLFTTFTTIDGDPSNPFFERSGDQAGGSPEGFVSNRASGQRFDVIIDEDGNDVTDQTIGDFFLRASRTDPGQTSPFSLRIDFGGDLIPSAVSFDILDLDGVDTPGSSSFGTEAWDIFVTNGDGDTTLGALTPEVAAADVDFDAKAFNVAVGDQRGISSIELVFSGTKESGIGVGLDNLRLSNAVPSPGTAALLGLGGLAAMRRRR